MSGPIVAFLAGVGALRLLAFWSIRWEIRHGWYAHIYLTPGLNDYEAETVMYGFAFRRWLLFVFVWSLMFSIGFASWVALT